MYQNIIHYIEERNLSALTAIVENEKDWSNHELKNISFLYSCKLGHFEISRYLLKFSSPNCRYGDGQIALMLLSQSTHITSDYSDFYQFLIDEGCKIDLVDYCGKTALHWAAIYNNSVAIRILLKNRCSINSVEILGYTALMYAVKADNVAITTLLLHSGADVNKNSKQHGTVFHIGVRFNSLNSLQQLITFSRHLNLLDSHNFTPLDLAVARDQYQIISMFINSGRDLEINRRPCYAPFRTPLEQACLNNNSDIVELLLKNGADPNFSLDFPFELESPRNRSKPVLPLILALNNRNYNICQALLTYGASIEASCPRQSGFIKEITPLKLAAEFNDEPKFLNLLLDYKNKLDNLHLAESNELFLSSLLNYPSNCRNSSADNKTDSIDVIIQQIRRFSGQFVDILMPNGVPVVLNLFIDDIPEEQRIIIYSSFSVNQINQMHAANMLTSLIAIENNQSGFIQCYRISLLNFYRLSRYVFTSDASCSLDLAVEFIADYLHRCFLHSNPTQRPPHPSSDDDIHCQEDIIHIIDRIHTVFNESLIRRAIHQEKVWKAILFSKSIYAMELFLKYHFSESLIERDNSDCNVLSICEMALFFDNIDAALILNLVCGANLDFFIKYNTMAYTPEVLDDEAGFNDNYKIFAIKKLSNTVKPLRCLCIQSIRHLTPSDESLLDFAEHNLNLVTSPYCSKLIGQISINSSDDWLDHYNMSPRSPLYNLPFVKYHSICRWLGINAKDYQLDYF